MTQQKSALNVAFGSMTFGREGTGGARVHDHATANAILDEFQAHGHNEVDSARVYCGGTCEEMLGELNWQKRGLDVQTKLAPRAKSDKLPEITHQPDSIRKHLEASLAALKTDKVSLWYLHVPDHTVPYEMTLKTVNDLHKEGKFDRLGISNYSAWETAEICMICEREGWIKPSGVYNAVHRGVEPELFPCLRQFGLSFYEFNPLAGGYLTDRYVGKQDEEPEAGSRFDPKHQQGSMYRKRYWKQSYFDALKIVDEASKKAGLTIAECALRWVSHHSLMKREHGDTVLIGASSLEHIKQNLVDLEKGPLPKEVIDALDAAWEVVKGHESQYFR